MLFTLVLIAGGLFYLGWIQIHLDENTYGAAFTKSKGYLDRVYTPGNFSWSIQRIIPGNFKLIKIKILPKFFSFTRDGALPSGEVYGKLMNGQPDFSFSVAFSASYLINPESLPLLLKDNLLDPASPAQFYNSVQDKLSSLIFNVILKKVEEASKDDYRSLLSENYTDAVTREIKSSLPYITLKSLTITRLNFPDMELYKKARENYFSYLASRTVVDAQAKQKAAEDEINEAAKIELLKKYGELLKKYPELVQVLSANNTLRSNVIPTISLPGEKADE